MYPGEFEYYRAEDVGHALDLMDEHADTEAELLSGGHSLLPTMKTGLASPDVVIDIGGIDALSGVSDEGDHLAIGANTNYSTVADSETVRRKAPVVAGAAAAIGDTQVRNRGTVGGNLAHADPASDLPGAAIAADATVVAEGPDGEREIPVDDFFVGIYATALGPEEILTRIEVPAGGDGTAGAYVKKPNPASGYALVGVGVTVAADGSTVRDASVGVNGVMNHGVRLEPVEEALVDGPLDEDAISAAAERATENLDPAMMMEDTYADAEYREQLVEVYTGRALREASEDLD